MNKGNILLTDELASEFEQFKNISTPEEKKAFMKSLQKKYEQKTPEEKGEYLQNLIKSSEATIHETKKLIVKKRLLDVKDYISLAEISRNYFGKSRSWLMQRINEDNVNGKPAEFTGNEIKRLSEALEDIADRLKSTAAQLRESA